MEKGIKQEQRNLINIDEEEVSFFDTFLKNKGIKWNREERESRVVILSNSLVGYIKTPLKKIILEPKYKEVNISHVLRLYNYVYSYGGSQDDELLDVNPSAQSGNIIKSFLQKLRENIPIGILQDYFVKDQKINFLKGKVDFITTYKNILKHNDYPVSTEMHTLSPNTAINRLIKGALLIVSRSTNDDNLKALDLLDYFISVDPILTNATEFFEEIYFDPKNIRYKKIAMEAAMIIDSLYYDDISGSTGGESFLINFDTLFEQFIQKVLIHETNQRDFSKWTEPNILGKEYLNGFVIKEGKYNPDLMYRLNLEDDRRDYQASAVGVLDVKNKANNIFNNQDLYQIVVYSQMLYSEYSILIYPSFFYRKPTVFSIDNSEMSVQDVNSCFIDIVTPSADAFKQSIVNFIEDIYGILEG